MKSSLSKKQVAVQPHQFLGLFWKALSRHRDSVRMGNDKNHALRTALPNLPQNIIPSSDVVPLR